MIARHFAQYEIRSVSISRNHTEDALETKSWDPIREGSNLDFRTLGVPEARGGPGADLVTHATPVVTGASLENPFPLFA